MLLVNASAGPSQIHGTGLIAREAIPAGTLVWELKPGFDLEMTKDFVDSLSRWAGEQIRRFLYVDISTGRYVLCSDDGRFMNHADHPNTRTVGTQTFAIRAISSGEEITCNYSEFDAAARDRRPGN